MTSIINRLQLIVAIKFDNQFICHSQYCLIQLILITVPVNRVGNYTVLYIYKGFVNFSMHEDLFIVCMNCKFCCYLFMILA